MGKKEENNQLLEGEREINSTSLSPQKHKISLNYHIQILRLNPQAMLLCRAYLRKKIKPYLKSQSLVKNPLNPHHTYPKTPQDRY